jgi:hypothetical protein
MKRAYSIASIVAITVIATGGVFYAGFVFGKKQLPSPVRGSELPDSQEGSKLCRHLHGNTLSDASSDMVILYYLDKGDTAYAKMILNYRIDRIALQAASYLQDRDNPYLVNVHTVENWLWNAKNHKEKYPYQNPYGADTAKKAQGEAYVLAVDHSNDPGVELAPPSPAHLHPHEMKPWVNDFRRLYDDVIWFAQATLEPDSKISFQNRSFTIPDFIQHLVTQKLRVGSGILIMAGPVVAGPSNMQMVIVPLRKAGYEPVIVKDSDTEVIEQSGRHAS